MACLRRQFGIASYYGAVWLFNRPQAKDAVDNISEQSTLSPDKVSDEKEGNEKKFSYTSAAWGAAAATGRMASSAVSSSWNYCKNIRFQEHLKLEQILYYLQTTKNISEEYIIYVFDILQKSFFSILANSYSRLLVFQIIELLLGFPPGTALIVERGIPFLQSAIQKVLADQDATVAMSLLRVVNKVKDQAPQLATLSLPLLLWLFSSVQGFENLQMVLSLAKDMAKFLSPDDMLKILLLSSSIVGYSVVKEFGKSIGFEEKDFSAKEGKCGEGSELSAADRKLIAALLGALTVTWFKHRVLKSTKSKL